VWELFVGIFVYFTILSSLAANLIRVAKAPITPIMGTLKAWLSKKGLVDDEYEVESIEEP